MTQNISLDLSPLSLDGYLEEKDFFSTKYKRAVTLSNLKLFEDEGIGLLDNRNSYRNGYGFPKNRLAGSSFDEFKACKISDPTYQQARVRVKRMDDNNDQPNRHKCRIQLQEVDRGISNKVKLRSSTIQEKLYRVKRGSELSRHYKSERMYTNEIRNIRITGLYRQGNENISFKRLTMGKGK